PPSGALRLQVVEDLAESFDVGSGGWRHRAIVLARPDPWQLAGAFNHGAGSGRAWWCGGGGGEYPVQTAAELASDWFRVDDAARASVWSWIDAETDGEGRARDGGRVEIRAEGDPGWSVLVPVEGYSHALVATAENALGPDSPCLSGRDTSWRQLHFDLQPWSGQRVRFRFVFASDAVATTLDLRGWLVDDFHFEAGTNAPTDAVSLPRQLELRVGPNPFNPRLSFDLQVPAGAGHLQLVVMDARGRVLRRVLDATLAPGPHRLGWDGADEGGVAAASGVYYYRLSWAQGLESGKVVLLR
ncbi:MAG TPA: FlgD immunoglobulin-like domain containing protein, partial [Candidatus Krumholzibacteria bacterium]|nr:FlgD immunoglobulin-like domain containing protein [Candidatus Krumholzibacteria bacterium]